MNVLLIGVGYVGTALLEKLDRSLFTIHVTTTEKAKESKLKAIADCVTLLTGEDESLLKAAIEKCEVLIIMIAPKKGASYADTYLKMAESILRCIDGRTKPLYLIYTSSTSVYEGASQEWVDEDLVLNPTSENGKILLATENLYLQHPTSCVLRLGGIYGPGRDLDKRALYFSGKEFPSSGDEFTNHIHLEDIVSTIQFCLRHRLTGIYNVVNNQHPTRRGLYGGLCRHLNIPQPIWNGTALQKNHGYKVSNKKIENASFTPSYLCLTEGEQNIEGQTIKSESFSS